MTSVQLRKMAGNPKFIPGIYNYCDRWCERCSLAHRCLNRAMELEEDKEFRDDKDSEPGDPAKQSQENEKLWQKVAANLKLTLQMVKEDAKRRGVDLNDPALQKAVEEHQKKVRRRTARHRPLVKAAKDYGMAVQKWFDKADKLFKGRGLELAKEASMRPMDEAEELKDLVEIIQWYHLFICVKLQRAIGAQAEAALEEDPEIRALRSDGDGSAKIALIALDRSLGAWGGLRKHFPEQEDTILDFQVQLARIRTAAESVFPKARAFVRPGFDEGETRLELGARTRRG